MGPFDVPASRYGARVQGADEIALTKLDTLSYLSEIPVCVAYEVDGITTREFPSGDRLDRAKPVVEKMPGWSCDITACRRWEDLPEAARNYVAFLEEQTGRPIRYVSVGADRDQYLVRE